VAEITVVDVDGRWVLNPNAFPFADPETRVVFAPGQVYKVKFTEDSWIGKQMAVGVLAKAPDPMRPDKSGAAESKA
jgi:hypothetical protein